MFREGLLGACLSSERSGNIHSLPPHPHRVGHAPLMGYASFPPKMHLKFLLCICPNLPIHPSFIEAGKELATAGDIGGAIELFRRARSWITA